VFAQVNAKNVWDGFFQTAAAHRTI